jgi:predicted nuclease with TOPRIM domain
MSSGNNRGAPRGQPGRGQFQAARAAANPVPFNPQPPAPGQNNPSQLRDRLNQLVDLLEASKNPIMTFIRNTEPAFLNSLNTKIGEIRDKLSRLTIEDNNLSTRIVALRDSSASARADIDRLNQQLQQSQNEKRAADEAVARLQAENQQGRDAYQALEAAKAAVETQNNTNLQIIQDATGALDRLNTVVTEIQGLNVQNDYRNNTYNDINNSLEAISGLIETKLNAYNNILQQAQQGGKKLWGGYSYPSEGYNEGQEVIFGPSARSSRPSRPSSTRRKKHRTHHNKAKSRSRARA